MYLLPARGSAQTEADWTNKDGYCQVWCWKAWWSLWINLSVHNTVHTWIKQYRTQLDFTAPTEDGLWKSTLVTKALANTIPMGLDP